MLDDGTVRCWGANDVGQLGLGNTTDVGDNEVPSAVPTVDIGPGRTAKAIAAGGVHTCGCSLRHACSQELPVFLGPRTMNCGSMAVPIELHPVWVKLRLRRPVLSRRHRHAISGLPECY